MKYHDKAVPDTYTIRIANEYFTLNCKNTNIHMFIIQYKKERRGK